LPSCDSSFLLRLSAEHVWQFYPLRYRHVNFVTVEALRSRQGELYLK
jgi:hypothetical protein